MSSSNYEPLPQDGPGVGDPLYDERTSTRSGPVRPPTYYGEGSFDPPSSEDEDESLLLKENNRSLGMVERAGYAEPDVKVRLHRSASNQALSFSYCSSGYLETNLVAEISAHIFGHTGSNLGRDWNRFCAHV